MKVVSRDSPGPGQSGIRYGIHLSRQKYCELILFNVLVRHKLLEVFPIFSTKPKVLEVFRLPGRVSKQNWTVFIHNLEDYFRKLKAI